jgi:hypothetical protein
MTFVQATTGGGGWPMSVWLTPDLKPFYGGTYYPGATCCWHPYAEEQRGNIEKERGPPVRAQACQGAQLSLRSRLVLLAGSFTSRRQWRQ